VTSDFQKPDIPGADAVVDWFGYWPTFHDAEVLAITINRSGPSTVVVYTFDMTEEVDPQGFYVLAKHAIVTFAFEGFLPGYDSTRIMDPNHQNVLSSLWITKIPDGFELNLEECYGVSGVIRAARMEVKLEPGQPPAVAGGRGAPSPI
jgi:hypothetical protein